MTTYTLAGANQGLPQSKNTVHTEKLYKSVVNVSQLSADDWYLFVDEIGALSETILDGIGRDYLAKELTAGNLIEATALMMRDEHGELVGFNLFRLFENVIDGKIVATFRAAAAIQPRFRGRNSVLSFAFGQAIAYKLRHPLRQLNFIFLGIHPSSYYLVSRYAQEIWPRYEQETPAETYNFMQKLFAASGVDIGNEDGGYIFQSGKFTVQNAEEASRWKASDKPEVQYFLRQNPGYEQGDGLACMIPLTFVNIFVSGVRFVTDKLRRNFK